jgi:hypothetical protein
MIPISRSQIFLSLIIPFTTKLEKLVGAAYYHPTHGLDLGQTCHKSSAKLCSTLHLSCRKFVGTLLVAIGGIHLFTLADATRESFGLRQDTGLNSFLFTFALEVLHSEKDCTSTLDKIDIYRVAVHKFYDKLLSFGD